MRNAKGLMQIDVANVGSELGGAANADLRIEIGAVHVNLSAMLVNDLGRFL